MSAGFLFAAVFLACVVEAVEALTIVLAVGITRGWRSPMYGTGAALVTLAVIIAALGPALKLIPLHVIQLVVGGLLLVFGLQWLRKAMLRSAGIKAKHDEDAIYQKQVDEATGTARAAAGAFDSYSFRIAFMGVLLEGLEVAFIVLTFGTTQGNIPLAALAAVAAVVVIVGVGVAVRAPLARVPENMLKYAVGLLLTTFGIFWGAEGAGAKWPASDASILVLLAVLLVISFGVVQLLKRDQQSARLAATPASGRRRGCRPRADGSACAGHLHRGLVGRSPDRRSRPRHLDADRRTQGPQDLTEHRCHAPAIHVSRPSAVSGRAADKTSAPASVTSKSSSMRTPIPRNSGGTVRSCA
jgi:uncharacterized membrane protein